MARDRRKFISVAMEYYTKLVEVENLNSTKSDQVIGYGMLHQMGKSGGTT